MAPPPYLGVGGNTLKTWAFMIVSHGPPQGTTEISPKGSIWRQDRQTEMAALIGPFGRSSFVGEVGGISETPIRQHGDGHECWFSLSYANHVSQKTPQEYKTYPKRWMMGGDFNSGFVNLPESQQWRSKSPGKYLDGEASSKVRTSFFRISVIDLSVWKFTRGVQVLWLAEN